MPRINYALLRKMPEEKQSFLGFYPDVLPFLDNRNEYTMEMARLASAKYLSTDGYTIKPVGTLRYVFETFMGWLGLNNACQAEKVQLGLYKFAYYGYLQGYPQRHLDTLARNQGLTDLFLNQLKQPRTNETTKELQKNLVNFYVGHVQASVPGEGQTTILSDNYSFGSTLANLNCWSEIPKLDPQNELLIARTIRQLENGSHSLEYGFFPNSKYALAVAEKHLGDVKSEKKAGRVTKFLKSFLNLSRDTQALVDRAVFFAPDICTQDKNFFIAFYLEKKDFKAAFALIAIHENIDEAVMFLTTHFTQEQILNYVQKDSPLAVPLSNYYLTEDTVDMKIIQFVDQFDSNMADRFPAQALRLLVLTQCYEEAFELYKQKDSAFFVDDLEQLANYFTGISQQNENAATEYRKQKNWEQVQTLTLAGIKLIEKALFLDKNENRITRQYTQRCWYAESLIEMDLKNDITACCIEDIVKAINLLNGCDFKNSNDKKMQQKILAKGLMRQADYLIHTISPLYVNASTNLDLKKHSIQYASAIQTTTALLKEIIKLLNGTSDSELKLILGKANYMVGDIIRFFDLPENSYPYFETAMKTVPTNPFYILRCSEIFEERREELRDKGVPLLKKLGYESMQYLRWDEQRWFRDKTPGATPIFDIHNLQAKEESKKRSFNPFK